jgi:hypothetical protein
MVTKRKFHSQDSQTLGAPRKEFSGHGDLGNGICAPLVTNIQKLKGVGYNLQGSLSRARQNLFTAEGDEDCWSSFETARLYTEMAFGHTLTEVSYLVGFIIRIYLSIRGLNSNKVGTWGSLFINLRKTNK